MGRSILVAGALLLAALLPTQAAAAEPRVGPPLDVRITASFVDDGNSRQPTTATLSVHGRQCLPNGAPAAALVTVDQFPGQVFTATPNDRGRWSVDITVPYPVETTYVINAECDNYFGTTVYPEATAGPDDLIIVVASASGSAPGGGNGGNPVANTGTRTTTEVGTGLAALVLGALLIWLGWPRCATQKVRTKR